MSQHLATPATKPQPVLIFGSIITGLVALFGSLAALGVTSDNETLALVGAVGGLVVAAINQGFTQYVKGQVVPVQDVSTYLDDKRRIVLGPAGQNLAPTSDVRVGDEVDLVPSAKSTQPEPDLDGARFEQDEGL